MSVLVQILALVAGIVPYLKDAGAITSIIATLQTLIADATAEVQAVWPQVQAIIAQLRSNGVVTADQLAALDKVEADADARFDAAAKAEGFADEQTGDPPAS